MKITFSLFLFFILFNLCAQEVVVPDTLSAGIPSEHELSPEAYESWKKLQQTWLKGTYQKVLKKNKINVTCKDCTSFYVEVILSIDRSGKLSYYKLLDGTKCGEPVTKGMELQLMKNFFNLSFPKELYDVKFRTRLGRSLRC